MTTPFVRHRITLSLTWHALIVACSIIILMIGALSFGGYMLYKKVLRTEAQQKEIVERQEAERMAREEEAAQKIQHQQEELAQAKSELEKTKTEAAKTNEQVQSLSQALKETKAQKDIVISSSDLSPYLTGVAQIICVNGQSFTSGSGSLFTFKEVAYGLLTNYHVVKDADRCVVVMTNAGNSQTGVFSLKDSIYTYNQSTDEAILEIGQPLSKTSVPIKNYNYSLASLKKCTTLLPVGTPVVIVGFPAYAKRDTAVVVETVGTVNAVYRTVTNGIISGYDTSTKGEPNYFVSAKIDNGNSGGMAIAKDTSGLCALGLPTWLTVGNYETQGLVQNIMNVLPAGN